MAPQVQTELFPRVPAKDYVEAVKQRLGTRAIVGVSDVAAACNVGVSLVYAWMDEGLISFTNVASKDSRPYYRIHAPSVVAFIQSRSEELR